MVSKFSASSSCIWRKWEHREEAIPSFPTTLAHLISIQGPQYGAYSNGSAQVVSLVGNGVYLTNPMVRNSFHCLFADIVNLRVSIRPRYLLSLFGWCILSSMLCYSPRCPLQAPIGVPYHLGQPSTVLSSPLRKPSSSQSDHQFQTWHPKSLQATCAFARPT